MGVVVYIATPMQCKPTNRLKLVVSLYSNFMFFRLNFQFLFCAALMLLLGYDTKALG